jgi:Uma2 family endonuclease
MAATFDPAITPDAVFTFEIRPGTLLQFLETRAEGGPRLKCFEGSVTLVSPGMPHEEAAERLATVVVTLCLELHVKYKALASTTWTLPFGSGDIAYEADKAYYIQSHGTEQRNHPPDLVIEVVVSHPEKKALQAGALLKIPEMWVFNLPLRQLTFHHLTARGKSRGSYRPMPRSRAFPVLTSAEVLERLDDPATDDGAFHEGCRAWAKRVLVPRLGGNNGGG